MIQYMPLISLFGIICLSYAFGVWVGYTARGPK